MSIGSKKFSVQDIVSIAMLVFLFLYMFVLNFLMPLHRDDYEYALIWDTYQKITTFPDVFQSLYLHYFAHGGRMVDFFVLDTFLLWGKQWFNPFNAFLFVALIILIYWHSQQKITYRFNPYILALIILFCWLGLPDFAVGAIWMTGACVYLLTAVLIFAFLLPYHFHIIKKPLLKDGGLSAVGMFLGGVLAAWTIENTAATMNFIVACSIAYAYKKQQLSGWMVSGGCGSVLGFLLLVAAPGNYVRYAGQSTKLSHHFLNQIGAGIEIILGLLPVVLFLILVWRIVVKAYALDKMNYNVEKQNSKQISFGSIVRIVIIFLMLISYLNGSFIAKLTSDFLYENVAIPLGVANSHFKFQLYNTLSGLEDAVIYLLTVIQIYQYIFRKLVLRKYDLRGILRQTSWRDVMDAYPVCYFGASCVILAILNNLVMLGAPTFPGRAGFGSAVFFIIGAMSFTTIPQVKECLLQGSRKRWLAIFAGVMFIPMAGAVLHQHLALYHENNERMVYVEKMVSQGVQELELEPLTIKNQVLRHVYFVELNNSVSKFGFCRYYGLKDVRVKTQQ